MRYAIFLILLTAPGWLHGQKFSLPYEVADSALYLIKLGRACETVSTRQAIELFKSDSTLQAGKTVIKLEEGKNATLTAENALWERQLQDERIIWQSQKDKYRKQIRRQRMAIIGLSALGIVLAIL